MSKKTKLVLIILSALAFIFILSGINKAHINPFVSSVSLENMSAYSHSDKGSVLISDQNQKLLFLNDKNELVNILDLSLSGSPFDKAGRAAIYDGKVYVAGSSHYNGGIYLSGEAIAVYDLKGNFLKKINESSYAESEFITTPRVRNIVINDSGLFVTSTDVHNVSVTRTDGSTSTPVINCEVDDNISNSFYNSRLDQLYLFSRSRNIYLTSSAESSLVSIRLDDINEDIRSALTDVYNHSRFPSVTFEGKDPAYLSAISAVGSGVTYTDIRTGEKTEITEVTIAFLFRLLNILFYIGLIYLIAFVVVLIIKSIFNKNVNRKSLTVLGILFLVLITAIFYSFNSYKDIRKRFEGVIVGESQVIKEDIKVYLAANEEELKAKGIDEFCMDKEHVSELDNLQQHLADTCNSFGSGASAYAKVYLVDDSGNVFSLIESMGGNYYGKKLDITFGQIKEMYGSFFDTITKVTDTLSTSYVCCRELQDSTGKTSAVVMVGFYSDNLVSVQSNRCIELFVNLSAIMIVLYMCLSLAQTFFDDFKRRNSRPKDAANDRSADLAGIFVFLSSTISNIDSVILVFVSQYLCRDMDPVAAVAMAAIPLSAVSAGQWIGTFFITPFSKKIGERNASFISAAGAVFAMMICVVSITSDTFALFVVGKFLFGIFIKGGLYVLGDTIPFGASSEDIKVAAVSSTKESAISASILSVLVAGYISQYLSYSVIYLIGGVIGAGLLILIPIFFPKKAKKKEEAVSEDQFISTEENNREKRKKSLGWSMWITPSMIMMALMFMLPRTVMLGYSSYLFPLYTADAGISTILISNLSVYALTAVYIFGDDITAFSKSHKRTSVLTGSQLCIAASFLLFLVSPNIYWAIAVLFITKIMDRMTQAVATLHVSDVASQMGYDEKQEVSNYYTVNSGTQVLQSPILSVFLSLGYNFACAAVGAVCGLLISVFTLFNTKQNKKEVTSAKENA